MPRVPRHRQPSRPKTALFLVAAVFLSWLSPSAYSLSQPGKFNLPERIGSSNSINNSIATPPNLTLAQAPTDSIRQLTLTTNDIVYDPNTQRLYASVPSKAGSIGNSITPINPLTNTIGSSVYVGSEPGKLALSDNGQYLYVALNGIAGVRRFDVATQTPGLKFTLGSSYDGLNYAGDMAVLPGNPSAVAIARKNLDSYTRGVVIYDDGVQRPTVISDGPYGINVIESSASASTLYGSSGTDLTRLAVSASGVSIVNTTPNLIGSAGDMKFDNGLVYASNGRILNPETQAIVGTFSGVGSGALVVPDSTVGRVYFLTGSGSAWTLRAYDSNNFLQVGILSIPGVSGTPSSLVRWGANGLAFRTSSNQVFIIQTSLIPSSEPIPGPTPTPTATPTPSPTPELNVRQVSLPTRDMIWDANTQMLYASVSSSAGSIGNSITPINPVTATLGTSVFIGSEPRTLALSDNGQYLYVAMIGAATVRRFDIATQTAGLQFTLGNDPYNGPLYGGDMAVLPGSPESVAISTSSGVAIFDNGIKRPTSVISSSSNVYTSMPIEFSASASTLYGLNNGIIKMAVNPSGVTKAGTTSQVPGGGDIKFADGVIYTSAGRAVDPETGALLGTFTAPEIGSNPMVLPDPANGRVYFLGSVGMGSYYEGSTLKLLAFDQKTFLPLGSVTLPGTYGSPTSLVRWGANGLAFRANGNVPSLDKVVLIQTSLIPSSEPVPAPTPTPVPTPTPTFTPTPTPTPGSVRQVSLATNDLVYDAHSQMLYASVPSSAGSIGNSITPINPVTATLGTSVFIGSEPGKLALSDNGQYLYAALNGAAAVRRFDLTTQTAGLQWVLSTPNSGPRYAGDISVMPGKPETVAVSRRDGGSGYYAGIAIYDNGVQRPVINPTYPAMSNIEFSASPSVLYGSNTEDTGFQFSKVIVASCGALTYNVGRGLYYGFGVDFRMDNGLAYTTKGEVIDPEVATIMATFPGLGFGYLVAPDSRTGRVYFLSSSGPTVTLRAFDQRTFLPAGTETFTGISGNVTSLVRWGANGLAFRTTGNQVFIIQTSLIPDTQITPTPAPMPSVQDFSVSGQVTDYNYNPLSGVTVTLSGPLAATTQTDANGYYFIGGLKPCVGNYTITVSKGDYSFSPSSQTFAPGVSYSDGIQVINFKASPKYYTVSGQLTTVDGTGISGATVTLSGSQARTTITNDIGFYSFVTVIGGGNYTVTPTKTGYDFTPVRQSITGLSSNQTINFTGTKPFVAINGQVNELRHGAQYPVSGVKITLSGGQDSTTTTDANGYYSFANLPANVAYTLKASHPNHTFSPQGYNMTVTEDRTLYFTALPAVVISEFRLRGPSGSNDEFIEFYNNTDSPITVNGQAGSGGWALVAYDGSVATAPLLKVFSIPDGTIIPARGHYLATNSNVTNGPYSLGSIATGDITYTTDIPDNASLALFQDTNEMNFVPGVRMDAVGFSGATGTNADWYREGVGLAPIGATVNPTDQISFVRKLTNGIPQDTQDNAADFVLVSTDSSNYNSVQAVLGAPGPENLASPIQRNSRIRASLLDPLQGPSHANNRMRDRTPVTNGALGTLSIRRTYTNNTGSNITRLRFRIVDLTTLNSQGYIACPDPSSCGQADLRVLSSTDIRVRRTDGSIITVRGTTLEESSLQAIGGGLNSILSAGTITLETPLSAGQTVSVQFLAGVQQLGAFRLLVNVEALQ